MRLKEIRTDYDFKQSDIAHFLNIATNTYCNYENNNRIIPYNLLISLSIFYNTSVDYLLELTDQRMPYPRKKHNKMQGDSASRHRPVS